MNWLYWYLICGLLTMVFVTRWHLVVVAIIGSLLWPVTWAIILTAAVRIAIRGVKRGESH